MVYIGNISSFTKNSYSYIQEITIVYTIYIYTYLSEKKRQENIIKTKQKIINIIYVPKEKKIFFVVLILYIKTTENHFSFNDVNKRSMYIVHIFELCYIIFKHFRK